MRRSTAGRTIAVSVLVALTMSALAISAGAVPGSSGVVKGRVVECGPGPIVAAPGFPSPAPTPTSVILVHDRVAYASQSIVFPAKVPWIGSFSFTVPAGRYEIISTYQGNVRWVVVRPNMTSVVVFGSFICPQSASSAVSSLP
jgi:hypothetical protein